MRSKLENSQYFALFISMFWRYGTFWDLNLQKISDLEAISFELCQLPVGKTFNSRAFNALTFKLPEPQAILLKLEFSCESRPALKEKGQKKCEISANLTFSWCNYFIDFFNIQKCNAFHTYRPEDTNINIYLQQRRSFQVSVNNSLLSEFK